jgi:hypothetical protein
MPSREVIAMQALVVYESMYGNTRIVASRIADGLHPRFDVTVVPTAAATSDMVRATDLLVVGGPTHMHRMSTAGSRRMAAQAAAKDGSGLALDPGADGPGVREWLLGVVPGHQLAAAFDTRLDGIPALTGQASHGIYRLLKKRGYRLIVGPQSFLVDKRTTLADGEQARAKQWGTTIGGLAQLASSAA